jgi:hypothetical protein
VNDSSNAAVQPRVDPELIAAGVFLGERGLVATQVAAAGMGTGVFAPNPAAAHRWLELGVNFAAVVKTRP